MASPPFQTTYQAWSVHPQRSLRAVEQIRRMRGGSQAHLMRCSDDQFYVVKFQNNPQHRRVLVNELLATTLAARIGLPTSPVAVVDVSEDLIRLTTDLAMELPRNRVPCTPGLQFGSQYLGNPRYARAIRALPDSELPAVKNYTDFAGMLIFDQWTCNTDSRQTLFLFDGNAQKHSMAMIDQGFCFNCGEWNFPDSPLRGLYFPRYVYAEIRSLDDFEPWLSRLETEVDIDVIFKAASGIPPEWYDFDTASLHRLLEVLNRRRKTLQERLRTMCVNLPVVFPKWDVKQRERPFSPLPGWSA
jgi:HipA-like kinase